jgi:anti-anti-sigma regulatory factor
MNIVISQEEGKVPVTVFRLDGDLTAEEPLQSRATEAVDAGARYLLLDLSRVPYISSAGLRAIHYLHELLRDDAASGEDSQVARRIMAGTYKSPHLKLLKPSKNGAKALQVAGYDMFLEIHQNYKEAIASFH